MPDINGRTIFLDRLFDDHNGAVDTGAKAARGGDHKGQGGLRIAHLIAAPTRLLAGGKAGSYTGGPNSSGIPPVTFRKSLLLSGLAAVSLAGCAKDGDFDSSGGIAVTRSSCPAVAVPVYTGDLTLFDPATSRDARAIDVVATLTNVRSTCAEQGEDIVTNATFDVVAIRRDSAGARQVELPYFVSVVQGGRAVVSKRVNRVTINFAVRCCAHNFFATQEVEEAEFNVTEVCDVMAHGAIVLPTSNLRKIYERISLPNPAPFCV